MSDRHKEWASEAEPQLRRIIQDQMVMIEKLRGENFQLSVKVRELEGELARKPLAEVRRIAR